jgi:hypothetical protein
MFLRLVCCPRQKRGNAPDSGCTQSKPSANGTLNHSTPSFSKWLQTESALKSGPRLLLGEANQYLLTRHGSHAAVPDDARTHALTGAANRCSLCIAWLSVSELSKLWAATQMNGVGTLETVS